MVYAHSIPSAVGKSTNVGQFLLDSATAAGTPISPACYDQLVPSARTSDGEVLQYVISGPCLYSRPSLYLRNIALTPGLLYEQIGYLQALDKTVIVMYILSLIYYSVGCCVGCLTTLLKNEGRYRSTSEAWVTSHGVRVWLPSQPLHKVVVMSLLRCTIRHTCTLPWKENIVQWNISAIVWNERSIVMNRIVFWVICLCDSVLSHSQGDWLGWSVNRSSCSSQHLHWK